MNPTYATVAFAILVALLPQAQAAYGVDVSSLVTTGAWNCLKNNGSKFAIVRIYRSNGRPDRAAPTTIKNARLAGLKVEAYIYPCYQCDVPRCQVQAALGNLKKHNVSVSQVWIAVVSPDHDSQHWSHTATENVAFIREMVDEIKAQGCSAGILTRETAWHTITNDADEFNRLPLWYMRYDKKPDFGTEFVSFGGWTKPYMKQYEHVRVCNVGVGRNWYP